LKEKATMNAKLIFQTGGQRTFALVFSTGDEVMKELKAFAKHERLSDSHFTAIGAFSDAMLAYFDWPKKEYLKIPITEQVEVLAFNGDVALKDEQPQVHAHVVLGKRDGTAHGGHLLEAHVRPTLEVVLTESPVHLRRTIHDESGLALIDLSAGRRQR
jgi:predicted DNA-binding protein with PD1-like motif